MRRSISFLAVLIAFFMSTNGALSAQLQVGAFQNRQNIEERIKQINSLGYDVHRQSTAGELTRLMTEEFEQDRLNNIKQKLDQENIQYTVIRSEPEPVYRQSDTIPEPDLPAGLPSIGGYQRTLADTLLKRLKSVMGTEYAWGSESPSDGFDCSGLLYWLFDGETPRTVSTMWPWTRKIENRDLQPGDFIYFTFDSYKKPDHVGLYLGQGRFVHASSSYGVIKAKLGKSYYQNNLYGFGRPTF